MITEAKRLNHIQEYYFSEKLKEIRKLEQAGRTIINLGIGNPDMAPSEMAVKALVNSAQNSSHHGYQSYQGILALRKGFCEWYKKIYDVKLDPLKEMLILLGSKEGIMHTSLAFLNPGDGVLVPNPGYPAYRAVSKLAGAQVFEYELEERNNWLPDLDRIASYDFSKIKILWLNYPHMPTGSKGTPEVFERLIALARKHNFLIVHDNPYSLILNDTPLSIFNFAGARQVAIEFNSLSKSHNMAGWRVGIVAGKENYITPILKVKSNIDSGMFLPVQQGAIEALKLGQAWYQQINERYKERRKMAWELADLMGCSYEKNQAGLFVWAKISVGSRQSAVGNQQPETSNQKGNNDDKDFVEELLKKTGIFVAPGSIFGSKGKGYVRISLCSNKSLLNRAKKQF